MGLAVAEVLAKEGWTISIVDVNRDDGKSTAERLGGAFYEADVSDYDALASAFDNTFKQHGRLDFVFANAGIPERHTFYDVISETPPPAPALAVLDVNLKGAASSTYLAQHYFRLTKLKGPPEGFNPSVVMTASLGGILTVPQIPLYGAAKHGVVGLMRAVAPEMNRIDGIRVSCICPGLVKTNINRGYEEEFARMVPSKEEDWIPMHVITGAVQQLIAPDGGFGRCLQILPEGVTDVPGPEALGH